jgi:hypothetical protein
MTIRNRDPNYSERELIKSYRDIFSTSISNAHNLIGEDHQNIALSADRLNEPISRTMIMQGYFKTDVLDVLENDLTIFQTWIDTLKNNNGSNWDSTKAYLKNVVVNSGDSTYLCIKDAPVGTALTNTEYWVAFALKGEKGYNSLGVQWKGQYVAGQSYDKFDMTYVVSGNHYTFYVANKAVLSATTIPDSSWTESLVIDRRPIPITTTMPTEFVYPYDWLFIYVDETTKNATIYNVINRQSQPLDIVTVIPNVRVDTSNIIYINDDNIDMSTAIQRLYLHYNLN